MLLCHVSSCLPRVQEIHAIQAQHDEALQQAQHQLQDALCKERAESEDGLARHLAFIDRLMADKDELTKQLTALNNQLKVSWVVECAPCSAGKGG